MTVVDTNAVIDAIRSVLPPASDSAALHEPCFAGNEWSYVKDCLDTGWVSSVGRYVDRFEQQLADFTGARHAIAVVNGTAALHVCLKLAGVMADDEVLIPALTFVATANAVSYCGAVPHLVDSEEITLGMDPGKLDVYLGDIAEIRGGACFNKKTGRRIKAVVPMHTFGHPVDIEPLVEICGRYRLELIEDAAESLGSYYRGRHTGTWGKLSALSFNGNKIITTGGGGVILTDDAQLGELAKHLTTTAKVAHKWRFVHDQIGFNYRMPNINAAIGCAQLENLPKFIANKRRLAKSYEKAFEKVSGVSFFREAEFAKSNYWLNALLLERDCVCEREGILAATNAAGISTRPPWTAMHRLKIYHSCPRMDSLETAEDIERRLISIPSSAYLGELHGEA